MRLPLALAGLALVAAGCSDDPVREGTGVDGGGVVPACSDIWQKGGVLPDDYDGCRKGNTIEAAISYDCKDGTRLVGYDDRWWALAGQQVNEGGWDAAFNRCKP